MRPMLATPHDAVPAGDGWWHELKWDGMRLLADVRDHRVRLTTRTERDVTASFSELAAPEAGLTDYADLLLDGELVVLEDGVPSFGALAHRAHAHHSDRSAQPASAATYIVFDVLRAAGSPVVARPLRDRRALLEGIDLDSDVVRVSPVFTQGEALLDATREHALEGVVSKRIESSYQPGRRSDDWRKVVHRTSGSFVIGGMRPQGGGRGLGAVLLGTPTEHGLAFRGRVGAGLAGGAGDRLLRLLEPLICPDPPFSGEVPAADAAGTTWLRPALVADVAYLSTSPGGRLRQPTWRGLRADLTPHDLMEEG